MPPRYWLSRQNPTAIALWPLSKLFGYVRVCRSKLYDWGIFKTTRLPLPVVIVGNVVAGGVGKTPIVMALVERLQGMGYRPGVISRGYGRKSKDRQIVSPTSHAAQVGDEPLLIAQTCKVPVSVATNRVEAAQALIANHPECDILISDDGLQHRALARDLEIVVFDERGVGNNWLLPAGPLREPWPRKALCATHLTLQNVPRKLAAFAVDGDGIQYPLASLTAKNLHAVAGIAKPESFFDMLGGKGLLLLSTTAYPDHDNFERFAVNSEPNTLWLCTEKDASKLWALYPQAAQQILAVPLIVNLDTTFLAVFDATIKALLPHISH